MLKSACIQTVLAVMARDYTNQVLNPWYLQKKWFLEFGEFETEFDKN
jgi:hypothetical protein